MVRVATIPYLNTIPFVYGIKQKALDNLQLSFATPSVAAHQLLHNLCDVALLPVAAIPSLPWYKIVSNFCIGALSKVASVLLCSQIPVTHIKEISLDNESRTSVLLAKLLLRDYWRVSPNYVPLHSFAPLPIQTMGGADQPPPSPLSSPTPQSVVIIGDKALLYGNTYPYIYDLAEAWITWTGKPFVFAVWVANKPLPEDFSALFDKAMAFGVEHLDEAIAAEAGKICSSSFAKTYLTQNISYSLDGAKYEGLRMFLDKIQYL